jgi:CrcB protein
MRELSIISFIAVFAGGGIGSLCRYAVSLLTKARFGHAFPIGTLIVNLIGCFVIGYLGARFERIHIAQIPQETRDLCVIGILGGFTTFSAFGFETVGLLRNGAWAAAASNVLLNVVLGIGLVWLGFWLGRR